MNITTIKQIKSLGKKKEWNDYLIQLTDGKEANYFTRNDIIQYKIGDKVNYEIENKFGGLKFKTLDLFQVEEKEYTKSVSEENTNKFTSVNKTYTTDQKIAKQVALKSATELICSGKAEIKQILGLTEKLYQYLIKE